MVHFVLTLRLMCEDCGGKQAFSEQAYYVDTADSRRSLLDMARGRGWRVEYANRHGQSGPCLCPDCAKRGGRTGFKKALGNPQWGYALPGDKPPSWFDENGRAFVTEYCPDCGGWFYGPYCPCTMREK